jgi:glutamate racemase
MNPDPVAFLDSGVGGLPYLSWARQVLPDMRYVYVADREHFPYGEMDRDHIIAATLSVTERLMAAEHPRLVVVACNTMSVSALDALRARFPVPFVGVVPAVKPAAERSRKRRVGVLATRQTVEGAYLRGLIERHAADCTVVSLPAAGLVEFVEKDLFHADAREREERVRAEVTRFHDAEIDALVLGCTHFLHLETEFRTLLESEGIELVDSRDGVTRQVVRLLGERPSSSGPREPDALFVTGALPLEESYAWFGSRYGLPLRGDLCPNG